MCRVFGCVAADPVSVRHELLEADNPIIRQSEQHDSGWGMATYQRHDGVECNRVRFPEAAYENDEFEEATEQRGRIFNVHVRRATVGGLSLPNTHPFTLGNYSFGHNGTVPHFARLLDDGVRPPEGETDSEVMFHFLMNEYDPAEPAESFRRALEQVIDRSPFSGVNFLFSDGEKLYAYRLGIFELHWMARPGQLLVASERITADETWHTVQQDVLLCLDPDDLEQPHAQRLLGDEVVARADIRKYEEGSELRGSARGEFAAARAAELAATAGG
jgi:glutamine amidotransferase